MEYFFAAIGFLFVVVVIAMVLALLWIGILAWGFRR